MRIVSALILSGIGLAVLAGCGDVAGVPGGEPLDAAPDNIGPGPRPADAGTAVSYDAGTAVYDGGNRAATDSGDTASGPACSPAPSGADGGSVPVAGMSNLVPLPVSVVPAGGAFVLGPAASIRVEPATAEMTAIGQYLAAKLRPATGYALTVVSASGAPPCAGDLVLTTAGGDTTLGDEGYDLAITPGQVRLSAFQAAGVFRGLQTIRQLLPAAIESTTPSAGPWGIATGTIRDIPRFAWRGTMLDVARHFFGVKDVETYIDLLAYYKINTFHMHLSDDPGWRLVINALPNLATYGGSTDFTGGPGGYYTQADYSEIVAYAKTRYITVIAEIDMPSHTNAARASYADLNCDGVAPALSAGGGALCIVGDDATYTFVADVIGEIAGLSPGPYFHVGGDEASTVSSGDFQTFFGKVQPIVQTAGKQMIGWASIGQLPNLLPGSILQYWTSGDDGVIGGALAQGAKVLMSPANKAYMDMKYDPSTTFGQTWAGYIDEQTGYTWDPAAMVSGVADAQLVGLEAPLWTETLLTLGDVEYMAFPRIAGYAEIGWSPSSGRSWDEYKVRIGSQGPRLKALGVNYHPSTLIPWQ